MLINQPDTEDILIGQFHPSPSIQVIDFLGFYLKLKLTAEQATDISNSSNQGKRSNDNNNAALAHASGPGNAAEERGNQDAASDTNKSVYELACTGAIAYKVKLSFKDATEAYYNVYASCTDIPQLPPEEPSNQNTDVGNCPGVLSALTADQQRALKDMIAKTGNNENESIPEPSGSSAAAEDILATVSVLILYLSLIHI